MAINYKYIAPKVEVFDIYKAVFGYRALPYPGFGAVNLMSSTLNKLSTLGEPLFKKDSNGKEAFCPVFLSTTKVSANTKIKKYELPYSTISVTLQKNIQKTSLIGRNGSVKELIQTDDYKFTIRGVILGDDLPESGIKEIVELFKINEPLALQNAFTAILLQGNNSVVIESVDLPDMKGILGAQAYSIELVSDTILELEDMENV